MITDADKRLFIEITDKSDHDDEIMAGHHYTWEVARIAEYRIAAMIEGARLMRNFAADTIRATSVACSCRMCSSVLIHSLDPATVVKERG